MMLGYLADSCKSDILLVIFHNESHFPNKYYFTRLYNFIMIYKIMTISRLFTHSKTYIFCSGEVEEHPTIPKVKQKDGE